MAHLSPQRKPRFWLPSIPPAVIALGVVSFLTDFSSEMIYPLLPVFLSTVLGAGALALGLIEGVAESTASILKLFSGIWADRARRRKPLIVCGYTLSSLVRPVIGLAPVWPVVLVLRFLDRVGKGIRTSPRDAMIADVTTPETRGTSFGFHRAMDHAGAVAGPLVAAALMQWAGMGLRQIFLLAIVPALGVVAVLFFGIKESPRQAASASAHGPQLGSLSAFGGQFKLLLAANLIFTLGNSTDAFLLLRLTGADIDPEGIALLWALFHVVKMVSSFLGGRLADRVSRRWLLMAGWTYYAAIYLLFAFSSSPGALVAVFLAYGISYGLTEPCERALVADMVPQRLRATGFGWYHAVVGLGALPASILFGIVWKAYGSQAAFVMGALLALAGALMLIGVRRGGDPAGS